MGPAESEHQLAPSQLSVPNGHPPDPPDPPDQTSHQPPPKAAPARAPPQKASPVEQRPSTKAPLLAPRYLNTAPVKMSTAGAGKDTLV